MSKTYYDRLGVSPDADQDEVREAYKKKLHEYHPDVSSLPEDEAKELFYQVKEANILTDPEERARYDRLGHDEYVGNDGDSTSDSGSDEQSSGRKPESNWSDTDSRSRRTSAESEDSRSRSSAASEYRNRRRRTRSRSRSDTRSDTNSWSQSTSESHQRTRRRSRSESTSSSTDDGTNRENGAETTDDRDGFGGEESSTPEESSTTRSPGQPAASGMFVSPDIELLRFPATALVYFLGFEVGYSLLLSLALLPPYLYYRRHRFTEHFLTDTVLSDSDVTSASRRLFFGAITAMVSTIGLGATLFASSTGATLGPTLTLGVQFGPVPIITVVLGVAATVSALFAVRSLSQLLLYDWYEAKGTNQPIAMEMVCRGPLLVLPLVLFEPAAFVAPGVVSTALLAVTAVGSLVYFVKTGKQSGVEFVDRAVA